MSKKLKLVVLASLALSQTGCIVGFISGNGPLFWAGFITWQLAHKGSDWEKMGFILDDKNPGRVEALNIIPLNNDSAKKFESTLDELATFNDELSLVHDTNKLIESNLKAYSEGKLSSSELESVSKTLGFSSSEEFKSALSKHELSASDLEKFAVSQKLSMSTARIYLQARLAINVAR